MFALIKAAETLTSTRSKSFHWKSILLSITVRVGLIFVILSILFFAFRILPGDPTLTVLGEQASVAEREVVRKQLLLDRPLYQQYSHFLVKLAHGRFGASLRRPEYDAMYIVLKALPSTMALAFLSVALGACFGLSLAILSIASKPLWVRFIIHRFITWIASIPLLALAPVTTWIFAVQLRWVPLPADPEAGWKGLSFIAILLAIPLSASVARIARAALFEQTKSLFLQVARAKGLREWNVWIVHALPVCAGSIVTVIASQLGALLGGAVILERLFERQGLGTVIAEAIMARDFSVIQASVLISAFFFVFAQSLGNWVHRGLDPRVRTRE